MNIQNQKQKYRPYFCVPIAWIKIFNFVERYAIYKFWNELIAQFVALVQAELLRLICLVSFFVLLMLILN